MNPELIPTPEPGDREAVVTNLTFIIRSPMGSVEFNLGRNTSIKPYGVGELVIQISDALWPSKPEVEQ